MIQKGVLNMDFTDKLDILYARRSSEDGKDGESIENQIALLKQYAADKGYYNIKVITDDGYTGTNFNRPGFQEALALIQHRRVGRFIVKDYCAIIGLNQKDLENQGILA